MSDTPDTPISERIRQALEGTTPGPWALSQPESRFVLTPQTIQIDEADWGQEAQDSHWQNGYEIGTIADQRAWNYADVGMIAAAPTLLTDAADEIDRLTAALAERDGTITELTLERDRAIEHDRQPYPTAWAYEQACKVIDKQKLLIAELTDKAAGDWRNVGFIADDQLGENPTTENLFPQENQ